MTDRMPAVQKGTAGWVLRLENKQTGQLFTADLSAPAPDVLPATEDAYRLLPALRAIASRARDLTTRLTDICMDDMTTRGATERRVSERLYRVEQDSEWTGEWRVMRTALAVLVSEGELSEAELNDALPAIVETTVKPNNTKLNALEKKRGGRVATVIKTYRRRSVGTPRIVEVI